MNNITKSQIEFIISAKYDAETFYVLNEASLENKQNVSDFQDFFILSNKFNISAPHNLSKIEVDKFIGSIYQQNTDEFKSHFDAVELAWGKIENNFFKLAQVIYKEDFILKNKYVVFPSIWSSFVRDFANKRISFPNSNETEKATFVIAHELLHVMFYQYLYRKHPSVRGIIESKKVWDFSEVINVLIQSQKEWIDIFTIKPGIYSEHSELYEKMSKIWAKNPDVDKLIKEILY